VEVEGQAGAVADQSRAAVGSDEQRVGAFGLPGHGVSVEYLAQAALSTAAAPAPGPWLSRAGGRLGEWKICAVTGERVHRDRNAALNLRDWPETHASCSTVGAAAPDASESSAGQDSRPPGAVGGRVRPAQPGWPQPMRPEPETEPRERVLAE
jgi:hypothetical protein